MLNLSKFSVCICCGRTVSYEQIAPGAMTCALCLTMNGDEIARTAHATALLLAKKMTDTAAGRKQARQQARQAQYEETGKMCSSCHARLPVSEFNSCAPRADGLQSNCRKCDKLRAQLISQPGGAVLWKTVRDTMRAQNVKK